MTNNRSEDMDTSSFCDADGFGISKDGFTACVNQTIFTLIPFLFLIIVIPKRIRYLNTLRIYKALDNPIDILKTSLILIQMLLIIADVADVYRNYNLNNEKTKSIQSISFLLGSGVKLFSWIICYYLLVKEIYRRKKTNLYGLKGFWRINLFCTFVTSVSYIPKYEKISKDENNYTQLILCCSEFAISIIFGIFTLYDTIIGENNNNPALDALNMSLQQNESKFSRFEVDDHESYSVFRDESNYNINRNSSNDSDSNSGFLDISVDETTRRERRPSSFDIIDNNNSNINKNNRNNNNISLNDDADDNSNIDGTGKTMMNVINNNDVDKNKKTNKLLSNKKKAKRTSEESELWNKFRNELS